MSKKKFVKGGIKGQTGQDLKMKKKGKNWIQGAIKRPGALHRALGVKEGDKIPASRVAAAARRGGKVGQEARLAQTLRGLHHKVSPGAKEYLNRVGLNLKQKKGK